jgi:hypothetical protein
VTFEPPVAAPRFMSNSVVSRLSTVAPLLLLVAALTTPLLVYAGMLFSVRTNAPIAVYRATPELQAARDWLAANSGPADLILGSWDVMNYVAAAIPGATLGGHPVATAEMARRRSVASSIFLDASRQEQAIRSEGATYLVSAGPHEPVFSSEARMVYRMGDVQVVALLAAGR